MRGRYCCMQRHRRSINPCRHRQKTHTHTHKLTRTHKHARTGTHAYAHEHDHLSPPKRHDLHLARPSHRVDQVLLHGDMRPKEVPHRAESEPFQEEADVIFVPVVVVFATLHPTFDIFVGGRGKGLGCIKQGNAVIDFYMKSSVLSAGFISHARLD